MGSLPPDIERVLEAALVSELTVIGPGGRPITHPMLPLYDGEHILLSSSVLFSRKLDHIRRRPRVAVAVTDPVAVVGLERFDRICVQGDARLLEGDLHSDWERILPLWRAKEPAIDGFLSKRVALPLFWERALIEVAPRKAWIWRGGRTDRHPEVFELTEVS